MGYVFLQVLCLFPASTIPPIFLLISILMYSNQKDKRAETGHLQRNAFVPSGNIGEEGSLMLLKLASFSRHCASFTSKRVVLSPAYVYWQDKKALTGEI